MNDQQQADREDEKRYQVQADANYAALMEYERQSRTSDAEGSAK